MSAVAQNWGELLTPQTTEAFFTGFTAGGRRSSLIETLFRMENSQRAFEEHIGIGQFGSEGWNFNDTGRVQYDNVNKGYKARFTHVEFAKGFYVERTLVEDNLFSNIWDRAEGLGDSAFRQREKSAANVFANAFTDTGIDREDFPIGGPDNVGLCSTAHPNSPTDSTTQSNKGTRVFSKDNVAATRQAMLEFADDRGDVLDVMPDTILVPPELEDAAIEVTKSQLDPDSANNAVNPQQGRYRVVVWHYLTDNNNWFMIDSPRMKRDLIWYERVPVEFARDGDFDTLQTKFRAYMRYSRYWRDWRWIYGNVV